MTETTRKDRGRGPADDTAGVADVVAEAIMAILPGLSRADLRPQAHLKDIGADSVDRVEIIMAVTERLGLDEPMSSFSDLADIGALIGFLAQLRSA